MDRTKVGYNYKGLFKNGVVQMPTLGASGEVAALSSSQGGFEVGGKRGLYADKYMPSFSDNFSKVWGTHTLKAGVFYEHIRNTQPASAQTQGHWAYRRATPIRPAAHTAINCWAS